MTQRIAAIIPAYNEEASIANVVKELKEIAGSNNLQIEAIVVNDCSADHTGDIISKLDCIALDLPVNLGIGGAVQTGLKYAFENNYDLAVQVDGDGQHPAMEIPKLVAAIKERGLDVAIGSRFIEKKGFQSSMMRRTGIGYFQKLNRFLTGMNVLDSTSGFRMFNRRAMEVVQEYYPDEYPEPEAIVIFAKNKLKVGEVPIEMKKRQGGVSSIGFFASIYYMWKVTLGILFTFIRR
jgi:glycosyltransferase involved in cell wall biosynthesis